MDTRHIRRLIREKLCDKGTYVVALVVGTLINLYGQLLVPWLRGNANPIDLFAEVSADNPMTTALSVFLGYAFPFCVGIYSSVTTRYKNRRIESIADFPERKPDPVFRVARNGDLVEAGRLTQEMFEKHQITNAKQILGNEVWECIQNERRLDPDTTIYFGAEATRYSASYAITSDRQINIYLTRLHDQ